MPDFLSAALHSRLTREINVFRGTFGAKTNAFGLLLGPSAFRMDFATEFSSTDLFSPSFVSQNSRLSGRTASQVRLRISPRRAPVCNAHIAINRSHAGSAEISFDSSSPSSSTRVGASGSWSMIVFNSATGFDAMSPRLIPQYRDALRREI